MVLDDRVFAQRGQPLLHVLLGTLEAQLPQHRVPDILESFTRGLFKFQNLQDDHRSSGVEDAAELTDGGSEAEADRFRALTKARYEVAPAK